MSMLRIVALSGSLRSGSYATAIIAATAQLGAERIETVMYPLHEVPLYNADVEQPGPAPVTALRAAIAAANGLIVSSPEYNYGIPGVLKNAIDWVSRPAYSSCLKGKPILLITSSPGPLGGVRAHRQLRDTFAATLSRVVARPEIVIGDVASKVSGDRFADAATSAFVSSAIDDLVREIDLVSR